MDEQSVRAALAGLPLGGLRYYAQTGSTNDDAAKWLASGAPHLALVAAGEQTAGRGREGRTWQSPAGTSLALSLVLRPASVEQQPLARYTALGSLAVCSALEHSGLSARIKWPNDVLLQGKKVAGVLAEAHWNGERLEAVILGIGINVATESTALAEQREGRLRFPATSVSAAAGRPVERSRLLRAVVAELLAWQARALPAIMTAWQERLAFLNEQVRIETDVSGKAASQVGRVLGLEPDGSLRLELADGAVKALHFGEIRLHPLETDTI